MTSSTVTAGAATAASFRADQHHADMHRYHVNEFAIASEFAFPCDPDGRSPQVVPEADHIVVRHGSFASISCVLRKVRRQLCYDVGNGLLLEPTCGAIHIDYKGRVITVDADEDNLPAACAWVVHVGLSAATLFRGNLPLHAASVELAGHVVAVIAGSGTGKSTLCWHLLESGARFGCDDLVPVALGESGVSAFPSVSLFPKLHRDVLDRFGIDATRLRRADDGTGADEYWVTISPAQRVAGPRPLAAVFLLAPEPDGRCETWITAQRLSAEAAAKVLYGNLHGVWAIGKHLDAARLLTRCAALARQVPVYRLRYVRAFDTLPALATAMRTLAAAPSSDAVRFAAGTPTA